MVDAGPPAASLSVLLSLVESRVASRLEAALASAGIGRRQLGALGHLRREPGLSVSELARRAGVTPQSMHATVGQMEREGLLRRAGTGRGRRAGLMVTQNGLRRLTSGLGAVTAVDDDLRGELGAEAYDITVSALLGLMDVSPGE